MFVARNANCDQTVPNKCRIILAATGDGALGNSPKSPLEEHWAIPLVLLHLQKNAAAYPTFMGKVVVSHFVDLDGRANYCTGKVMLAQHSHF